MAKFGVRIVLGALLMLGGVAARAFAVPAVDGFWEPGSTEYSNYYNFQYTDLGNMSCTSGPPAPPPAPPAPSGCADTGTLGLDIANGNLYIMLAQPVSVNDNSFGANAIGWGTTGHSLMDLLASDKMVLTINNPNGSTTPLWDGSIDYASDLTNIAAGGMGDMVGLSSDAYGSAGYGGDGATPSPGNAGALVAAQTSLGWDMANVPTACLPDIVGSGNGGNSPATTNEVPGPVATTCQTSSGTASTDWLYQNTYEVELNLADLGLENDSVSTIESLLDISVHNSPSKGVSNLCEVGCGEAVPEPTSLLLLGSGVLAAGTVLRRRYAASLRSTLSRAGRVLG